MFNNPTRIPDFQFDLTFPLKLSWKAKLPNLIMHQPASDGNLVIVPALRTLSAFSLKTGDLVWERPYRDPPGEQLNAFQATPAIIGDRVIATDLSATLYGLELATGKVVWAKPEMSSISEPIAVWEDKFFVNSGRLKGKGTFGYRCLTSDADVIWEYQSKGPRSTSSCAIGDGIMVFGDKEGLLYGLDADTGNEIWVLDIAPELRIFEHKYRNIHPNATAVPWISGDTVVIIAGHSQNILGIDLRSGGIRWKYVIDEKKERKVNSLACDGHFLYFICSPIELRKLSVSDGKLVFSAQIPRDKLGSPLGKYGLVVGDFYFCGFNESEKLVAFNHNDGVPAWEFQGEGSFEPGPIWVNDRLVVGNNLGNIYCFEFN